MRVPDFSRVFSLELSQLSAAPCAPGSDGAGLSDVLHDLNLRFEAGEQVALIGPSGAGKTTLLQVLACAQRPSQGDYRLQGQQPWQSPRRELQALRGRLFLAPQLPPLPPRQRVITALLAARLPAWSLWRSLRSLVYPVDIEAAHAALQRFDLAEKLFERVDRLSGGERQRVGLARALLAPARLWLLDEPLSALDPQRAAQAAQVLSQEARARGATLIASLHHVDMALAHFPRIIGLRQGRVLFDLPALAVSPALLAELYAQEEGKIDVVAPPVSPHELAPAPEVGLQCR
ncbi:phosphonate ABC transporter ATP-binding protein [Paucibacter sp. Y2R2-4]|uniref:phosphonate ABC transporter ATP-binding protein n=1 Tax=Paucibacter sp. Y2R2-4 TaxID=2893553 RepID=UPI0021E462F2|nr:ATP-binding cassette domain-containing protein [Paucibacter sp. Y2R2-4]MCV2348740.1 ATP-binding cassette domain-containing protein [Paucibacter sp. Y2R2-4]